MAEPNGFYYMRARYYDPKVRRFISEDPLGFDGGDLNLYAMVGNNPVMKVDPSGEFGIAGMAIGAGLDIGVQLALNGGDINDIDWADVGISAAVGFFAPGALSSGTKIYRSAKAANVINSQLQTAKAASKIAKLQGRLTNHIDNIIDNSLTQGAFQVGKQIVKSVFDYPTQTTQTTGK